MKLKGKRLLFLGTAVAAVSMVRYAREEGAYVIVTDNLPITLSVAKLYADEIADISTYDITKLTEFCINKKIDGVLCGVSENNLIKVRELCDRLNYPCYFTKEQWNLCQNKNSFKELCVKYGIPTPQTYNLEDVENNNVEYPVIVKPVDGFAAKGITICNNSEEISKAYATAIKESKSGKAIIEEYVIGDEVTAVYTAKDGKVSLSLFRDRYPTLDHENVTAQFDACLAPSIYFEDFMKTANQGLKDLLIGIGTKVGCMFFQGIAAKGKIYIFECGYRMNALCDYNNISEATGLNYMHMLVDYSLGADLDDYELNRDKPYPNKYYCIFNMSVHGGIISKMEGLERCLSLSNVIYAEFLLPLGYKVEENNSMAQSVFRAYINDCSKDELKKTIQQIQNFINVRDEFGNNMLFKKFDVERLKFVMKGVEE